MRSVKTEYRLETRDKTVIVYKGKSIEAHVIGDEETALHAIWVLEGSRKDVRFSHINGFVVKECAE